MKSFVLVTLLLVGVFLTPTSAYAFDYLEHSFFTDYACHQAQGMAAEHLKSIPANHPERPLLQQRLLTLALFCPLEWRTPYCKEGYKQTHAQVNATESTPDVDRDFSITLGDYAALPDHTARFGPVRSLTRARDPEGVLWYTFQWLTQAPDGPGGFVEDVAEDACETDGLVPWGRVKADVNQYLQASSARKSAPSGIPQSMLSPLARTDVPRGPSDPAGAYAFDHPHYLDLVLRNHNHFGVQAFSSWLGFHSAGVQVAKRSCTDLISLDADMLEELASRYAKYDALSWDEMSPITRREQGCSLFRHVLHQKILAWAKVAPKEVLAPVFPLVQRLKTTPDPLLLDALVSAMMGLTFEAGGLHFLQDGLAAGHMRTIRLRGGLQESRYDHDRDNAEGVVAVYSTRLGTFPFVAFGDSFLLGPSLTTKLIDCNALTKVKTPDPKHVTTCLIQHQRGLLVASSMASLLDWTMGGTLYGVKSEDARQRLCQGDDPLKRFVCAHLPDQPTFVAGEEGSEVSARTMHHGSLPVPPPPFSYESLSTRVGFDVQGRSPQAGVHLKLLSELGELANWLSSYRVGVVTALGEGDDNQWFADMGYGFHFRWAARFTVDAEASMFLGFRNFAVDTTFFAGLAPQVGLRLLPEGWTKLPLEIEVKYRLPFNFFASKGGFFSDDLLGGHWINVGLGLAFM